jgi:hypothetical protein
LGHRLPIGVPVGATEADETGEDVAVVGLAGFPAFGVVNGGRNERGEDREFLG